MATLTASTFAAPPRYIENGEVVRTGSFNSGSTEISNSATTILLCKIPQGARITDLVEHHTTGAGTCPVDYGIDSTLSAFMSQATQGSVNRLSVGANLNYAVSLSDDAAAQYSILKATATPGTATASLKINWCVKYTMDP